MQDKMSGRQKSDLFSKKIPENPRYKHVKPTLDTGASMSKYLEHLEDIKRNYKYRKDEIFSRLKVSTFAQLILQVADFLSASGSTLVPDSGEPLQVVEQFAPPMTKTVQSSLSRVVNGTGELDQVLEHQPSSDVMSQPPYLLLDVRDREDYDKCHIISARCYPATTLSRSCNYFTQDILDYKNKVGRIIILYDEDERMAPQAATVFVQRGVDNVFMLSGGLRVLYKAFPVGMISGQLPPSCLSSPVLASKKKSCTPINEHSDSTVFSHKDSFSSEDFDAIQESLDRILVSGTPRSQASSRSSAANGVTRGTSRASTLLTAAAKPWK